MAERRLAQPIMPHQRGPTCGLYALVAVARALNANLYADLYATKGDRHGPWVNAETPSLRYIAKRLQLPGGAFASQIGEIFSGQAMVALANSIGLSAQIVTNAGAWTPLIKSAIDKGHYLLAPFGVNSQGKPQKQGDRSHWCVIYGYKENKVFQNTAYVAHWSQSYQFGTSDIRKSSYALQPFQQTWHKIGHNLRYAEVGQNQVPVHAGGHHGNNGPVQGQNGPQVAFDADLPNDLAGQLVEVGL
jgi:hypothetical protein